MNANEKPNNLMPGPDAVESARGADLTWIAWLYSADELSAAAAAAFEARLERDPEAGLALAEAVRLEQGFLLATALEAAPRAVRETVSGSAGAGRKVRPILWMLVGAAFSLAMVAPFLSGWPGHGERSAATTASGPPADGDQLASVAQAWAERRAELADEEPALAALLPADEPALDDGELEPPAWLLLAGSIIEE